MLPRGPSLSCSQDCTLEARSGHSGEPPGVGGERRSPSSAWASASFRRPTCLWARARSLSASLSRPLRLATWERQVSWEKDQGQLAGGGGVESRDARLEALGGLAGNLQTPRTSPGEDMEELERGLGLGVQVWGMHIEWGNRSCHDCGSFPQPLLPGRSGGAPLGWQDREPM